MKEERNKENEKNRLRQEEYEKKNEEKIKEIERKYE
jgi:hypothetical protein